MVTQEGAGQGLIWAGTDRRVAGRPRGNQLITGPGGPGGGRARGEDQLVADYGRAGEGGGEGMTRAGSLEKTSWHGPAP